MRLRVLTTFALLCFASNSLLTRAAIGGGHLDAWTFMLVRMVTGALMLALLVRLRDTPQRDRGSWLMALALGGYAVLFTLAYARVGAGPGALLLFGSVQLTMFAAAHAHGERLSLPHWAGVILAVIGLLALTLPGLTAPDPLGAIWMAGAGACWGLYSLAGRRAADSLGVSADNFLRASAIVMVAVLVVGLRGPYSATGFVQAATSGALTSALAYAAWFSVMPLLQVWRAATYQLAVPVLTALGATALLREPITARLAGAMTLVLAGIWLTTRTTPQSR